MKKYKYFRRSKPLAGISNIYKVDNVDAWYYNIFEKEWILCRQPIEYPKMTNAIYIHRFKDQYCPISEAEAFLEIL